MKKIFLITALLISTFGFSQTPFPSGAKFPNATNQGDTLTVDAKIPLFNDNNVLNSHFTIAQLSGLISSGGTWGTITGTLSDQTDLQTILDTKLESADLDDYVTLNTNQTITAKKTFATGTAESNIRSETVDGVGIEVYISSGVAAIQSWNNSETGAGIRTINNDSGYGFHSINTADGVGITSEGATGSTGNVYEGVNEGVVTYEVNKEGDVTANSFIKEGGTSEEFLMADGSVSAGGGGSSENIYNTDGTLDSIRAINIGDYSLSIKDSLDNDLFKVENKSFQMKAIDEDYSSEMASYLNNSGDFGFTRIKSANTSIPLESRIDLSVSNTESTIQLNANLIKIDIEGGASVAGQVLKAVDETGLLEWADESGGGSGIVEEVIAGTGISVDSTDPANPIVASTITQYTDELSQDAVGTILTDTAEINFTYTDGTPSIIADIFANSIDESKLDTSVNASLDLADSSIQDLADLSITATATELNYVDGVTSSIQTQMDLKAPILNPDFSSGTPILPSTFTIGANSFIRIGAHALTITTGATSNFTIPNGTSTAMVLGAQQFNTARKTFNNNTFALNNATNTFDYRFLGGAIAATRNVSLPALTADDEITFNNATQTLTNKTIDGDTNTILDVSSSEVNALTGTGTAIDMSGRSLYNFSSASSATTFTMTNINVGGYGETLINTTSEPVVTGATKKANSETWVTGTDMILCVKDYNGTRKFWFEAY